MSKIDLGEEDGYVTVCFEGEEVRLDLFDALNAVRDYHEKNKAATDREYNAGLVELMVSLGLPRCSHGVAVRFVEELNKAVEGLKKKPCPSPGSPGSTGAPTSER